MKVEPTTPTAEAASTPVTPKSPAPEALAGAAQANAVATNALDATTSARQEAPKKQPLLDTSDKRNAAFFTFFNSLNIPSCIQDMNLLSFVTKAAAQEVTAPAAATSPALNATSTIAECLSNTSAAAEQVASSASAAINEAAHTAEAASTWFSSLTFGSAAKSIGLPLAWGVAHSKTSKCAAQMFPNANPLVRTLGSFAISGAAIWTGVNVVGYAFGVGISSSEMTQIGGAILAGQLVWDVANTALARMNLNFLGSLTDTYFISDLSCSAKKAV